VSPKKRGREGREEKKEGGAQQREAEGALKKALQKERECAPEREAKREGHAHTQRKNACARGGKKSHCHTGEHERGGEWGGGGERIGEEYCCERLRARGGEINLKHARRRGIITYTHTHMHTLSHTHVYTLTHC
jgi:hypothetical protein